MILRHLTLFIVAASMAACGRSTPEAAEKGSPCVVSADCQSPLICLDGSCDFDPLRACEPDTTRCNGVSQQRCVDDEKLGTRWVDETECAAGCFNGACRPLVCTPRTFKCEPSTAGADNSVISRCLADGSDWAVYQLCSTGCSLEDSGAAAFCNARSCEPFETRCSVDSPSGFETCNSTGTAWVESQCESGDVCENGRCANVVCEVRRSESGAITSREERCSGTVAERCNELGTAFEAKELCDFGCDEVEGEAVCAVGICTPLETRCKDIYTVESCSGRGTAWESRSCSGTGGEGRCVAGGCLPKLCSVQRNSSGAISGRDMRCEGNVRQQCNGTETGWEAVEICDFGCNPNGVSCRSAACVPGEMRCEGDAIVECAQDRLGFEFVTYCAAGCTANSATSPVTASCAPSACSPLARRCGFDASTGAHSVEVCHPDGSGFERLEDCAQGCSGGICTLAEAACTPGDVRCNGSEVEICTQVSSNATEWRFSERCLGGQCSAGACVDVGACGCAEGDDSFACGSPSRTPIVLSPVLTADARVPCDNQSRVLFTTNVITDTEGRPVPDGTLLTFTHETLTLAQNTDRPGADYQTFAIDSAANCRSACANDVSCAAWSFKNPGLAGPDGMCSLKSSVPATVSATGVSSGVREVGSSSLIGSGDVDPSVAGIQRPTVDGRAVVVVRAPVSCPQNQTVRVVASGGGRCSGSGLITFYNPVPTVPASKTVWITEDFSTRARFDRVNTTAVWDTHQGAAALSPLDFGTGRDGDIEVDGGALELDTAGYARHYEVTGMGIQHVETANVLPVLSRGDEVLLATVYGASQVRGVYEFKTVAEVASGRVVFTEPIGRVYSARPGGNADLTDHRVVLQRVPHFSTVRIGSGSLLTMSPMKNTATSSGGTGILALRVSGEARLFGSVSMNGLGMAAGTPNPGRPSSVLATLDRLVVGESPDGASVGGGAIYLHASLLSFGSGESTAEPLEGISSKPVNSGLGGSIWVGAGRLEVGSVSTRIQGGYLSNVRVDYASTDWDSQSGVAMALPSAYYGLKGASVVRSLLAFEEAEGTGTSFNVRRAELVGVVAGSGRSELIRPSSLLGGLQQAEPLLDVLVSADGGVSFGSANSGLTSFYASEIPSIGKKFLWEARLAPAGEEKLLLRALTFRLSLSE